MLSPVQADIPRRVTLRPGSGLIVTLPRLLRPPWNLAGSPRMIRWRQLVPSYRESDLAHNWSLNSLFVNSTCTGLAVGDFSPSSNAFQVLTLRTPSKPAPWFTSTILRRSFAFFESGALTALRFPFDGSSAPRINAFRRLMLTGQWDLTSKCCSSSSPIS